MRLSVRIKHKVNDEYGRHKENDLSDVSSKHNAGVRTVIVTSGIFPCMILMTMISYCVGIRRSSLLITYCFVLFHERFERVVPYSLAERRVWRLEFPRVSGKSCLSA